MTVWLPLDGTLIHCWLALSKCGYSCTYPGKMESCVSLGRKEGCTNIRISAKPNMNQVPRLECRDLTNCANHARHIFKAKHISKAFFNCDLYENAVLVSKKSSCYAIAAYNFSNNPSFVWQFFFFWPTSNFSVRIKPCWLRRISGLCDPHSKLSC